MTFLQVRSEKILCIGQATVQDKNTHYQLKDGKQAENELQSEPRLNIQCA